MKRKGDAHETLYLFFKRDGVPLKIVMNGSKKQTLGFFRKKCQESDCHIKWMDPYSSWQLQADRTIRYLNKGAGRKMVREGAPKRIWDNALDFEAYLRSNTDLDIYMMQGEVPETVLLGETSDICKLCEHGFYYWVMFRDEPIQYPDKSTMLGSYLGQVIDVDPAMTANIRKGNSEVAHH